MTIGASVLLIALGAILLFAITATVAGVSLNVVVGVVLIVAGAVELLIAVVSGGDASRSSGARADTSDRRASGARRALHRGQ
jgi:hypothetical protein